MTLMATFVRLLRYATDALPFFSFNKMGFALNRHGFEPADLPSNARGRIALVTGANSGIGRATSLELARRGFDVWLLCRDAARGEEARDAIAKETSEERVHLAMVDMSSLRSIRRFAQEFPLERVDVLVHNAGVLPSEKRLSEDGVELTFATNVLGPFVLTALLLPRLARSSDARVIFVASGGMYLQRLDLSLLDIEPAKFDGTRAYANAKRAQVILGHELARRFSGRTAITFASMHPGWADTTAVRTSLPGFHAVMKHFLRSAEEGADSVVWLAASERGVKGTNGELWFDRRVAPEYPVPFTRERLDERGRLVALCEQLGGVALEAAAFEAA
jgi:NAD(P)-dependent dehydrogenase (short-subunit alcohol dehydrogenase family)